MTVLVVADHDNSALTPITLNTVTAAATIEAGVHVLVAGANSGGAAEATSKVAGVVNRRHRHAAR